MKPESTCHQTPHPLPWAPAPCPCIASMLSDAFLMSPHFFSHQCTETPSQHPRGSVLGAAQPHRCPIARTMRGVQPAPLFALACSDLPGITTSNPSITINMTYPNNWPSSLTHCYPLVLDQLGHRLLPGELSAPGSTRLSSSLPDTQNTSPGPSDSL